MANKRYATIEDIVAEITPAFGDFAQDFDIVAIAKELANWVDGTLWADVECPEFWEVAEEHEIRQGEL